MTETTEAVCHICNCFEHCLIVPFGPDPTDAINICDECMDFIREADKGSVAAPQPAKP